VSQAANILSYAVRPRVLVRHLGQLLLVAAALNLPPAAAAAAWADWDALGRYLTVIGVQAGLGWLLSRTRAPADVQTNEAMILAALIFLVSPLFSAWPLMAAGLGFADAAFEAVSGVTTTGLTTVSGLAERPPAFLLARAWMQWYGGLGIVVLSLAVVVRPGLAAVRLAAGEGETDLVSGTRVRARRFLGVYAALTAAGVLLLWGAGEGLFNAAAYALAAVSTGGFAPGEGSLGALSGWPARAGVTLLCLAGAAPLVLHHRLHRLGPGRGRDLAQLYWLAAAGLAVSAATFLCLMDQGRGWADAAGHGVWMGLSAQTTSGFSSLDPASLSPAGLAVLMAAMAVGGGVGSTAGGFKVLRLIIAAKVALGLVARTGLPPHAVRHPRLAGRRLGEEDLRGALVLILLFVAVVAASWLAFLAAGYDPLDSLFEVVSATGTVGLSTGITSPELPAGLKAVLAADMLLGRLEIVAWLVLLYPRTWLGRRKEPS
jgi:trk system potassium uptake protein TrkH